MEAIDKKGFILAILKSKIWQDLATDCMWAVESEDS